ncbi:MAG: efflux RND transporter periplasmic adaptor subunit, partial [Bacteroidota bacterium]
STNVASTLDVQGELAAFNKIDIFSEVSGTLKGTDKPFKVGSYFPKGSVLMRVDETEAQLNLLAQKSTLLNAITQLMPDLKIDYQESFQQWKTYLDNYDVEQTLEAFPKPLNDQEKYFIASRNLLSQFYSIKSLEERLSKYEVKAPFSGVITQTSIQPGALVRSGQKLGELMNTSSYELEVTIPLKDLQYIKTGSTVQLNSRDVAGSWTGRIKRINDQVDSGTQTVKVFISVNGKKLKEGMYMLGEVDAKGFQNAIRIPRNLLVNQTSVFAVHENQLKLEKVEVLKITEDYAVIRGLEDGTPILSSKLSGAFEGMKVEVKGSSSQVNSSGAGTAAVGG